MTCQVIRVILITQLLSFAVNASQINAESGGFFFRGYAPKTYRATPQNWAVVQDHRGVIYVGNNEGVLEYDGEKWRKLTLPNSSTVRSLGIDSSGRVYVGGQAEIGFLKAGKTATLEYVSLLDQVAANDRVFSDVWTILPTSSGIVFSSNARLFRWSPQGRMQVWKSSSSFSTAFLVDDTPYVIEKGLGLYRLRGDLLEPVAGTELLAGAVALRAAFRFAGSVMVATPEALYREKSGRFEEYKSEAQQLLHEAKIYRCLPLEDGTVAIGTVHRGVILLSAQGKILRIVDSGTYDLHGSSINSLYRDREGGLWLALNNGLARVDVSGPVTRFSDREGLQEIVISIARHDGFLYAGTMAGLSRLVVTNGSARFEPVAGLHGQVPTLISTQHGLLAGSGAGISEVTKEGVRQISSDGVMDLALSAANPLTVYAVGRRGLSVFHLDGAGWQQTENIDSGGQTLLSVAEDVNSVIWATTASEIWRFDLGLHPAKVERFQALQGVPSGWKAVSRLRNSVLFATQAGVLRYDSRARRFIPDTSLGTQFAQTSRPVSTIYEAPGGDVWIAGEGFHGVLEQGKSGAYSWHRDVLGNFGLKELYALYVDPDGTLWAAGIDGGLVRYEPAKRVRENAPFETLLRQVQVVGRERTVFGGAVPLALRPKLPYQENALHFDFAAPVFEGASEIEYRMFLEGLGRSWSPWTARPEKEYTNIWEGNYVFHVQARDSQGRLGREAVFGFRVLPPLYRQWWAYGLYALLALGLIWLIIQWRLLAVQAQNRRLEAVVEQRTDEVRRQRDEIRAQEKETNNLLLNILPARVAEELRTTGAVAPLLCDDITVCFTDFVKFTLSSEAMPPAELVAALNLYFSEFDRIVERYGLEKIKTIGDSYMFVSGLPGAKASHAVDAVLAALEIVEAVKRVSEFPPGWQVRVGLHSGPVVAGVVGLRKFAFDIWGKTVNFASRHESSGQPNSVNISQQTYELISDFFQCQSRGPVLIKEGRSPEMYLVECIHDHLCRPIKSGNGYIFEDLYQERFRTSPPTLPDLNNSRSASHDNSGYVGG